MLLKKALVGVGVRPWSVGVCSLSVVSAFVKTVSYIERCVAVALSDVIHWDRPHQQQYALQALVDTR